MTIVALDALAGGVSVSGLGHSYLRYSDGDGFPPKCWVLGADLPARSAAIPDLYDPVWTLTPESSLYAGVIQAPLTNWAISEYKVRHWHGLPYLDGPKAPFELMYEACDLTALNAQLLEQFLGDLSVKQRKYAFAVAVQLSLYGALGGEAEAYAAYYRCRRHDCSALLQLVVGSQEHWTRTHGGDPP